MAKVFYLSHRSDMSDFETEKFIGIFSSKSICLQTIEHYRTITGFIDTPDQFIIKKYLVSPTAMKNGTVYHVYFYFDNYYDNYIYISLGVFGKYKNASKVQLITSKIFPKILSKGEVFIDTIKINKLEWCEGFK